MSPLAEALIAAIDAVDGLERGASRLGSGGWPAWFAGGREVAHLHAGDRIDLRLPRATQRRLGADPRVRPRKSRSAWLELELGSLADVADVVALVRMARAAEPRR